MAGVRPTAVAGLFYPDCAQALEGAVDMYVREGRAEECGAPVVLIGPHAGYVYSGPVAGSAYAALLPHADAFDRVVLIGPAHRVYVRGLAAPTVDAFRTPLGDVPLDKHAIELLAAEGLVRMDDRPHGPEHGLEVHLPFLQRILKSFLVVPLVVGDATDFEVAAALRRLWRTPRTLLVVSTDLSHFLDHPTATARDVRTAEAIEALDFERICGEDACGWLALRGALKLARLDGLEVSRLDLRNSGDTAGDRDRVVGYGAWVIG